MVTALKALESDLMIDMSVDRGLRFMLLNNSVKKQGVGCMSMIVIIWLF